MIEHDGDAREVSHEDLPLTVGGRDADIEIDDGGRGVEAWIAADGDDLFIQPPDQAGRVRCNGAPVTTSQWLRDGDEVAVGPLRIVIERQEDAGDRLRIEVDSSPPDEPPVLTPPPREHVGEPPLIVPVDFAPRSLAAGGERPSRLRWALLLTWVGLAGLIAAAWFTFSARTVEVRIEPSPDRVAIRGPLPRLSFAGRYLLRPGTHTLTAEREGYRRLETTLEVTDDSHQVHDLRLELLPGLLVVETVPAEGVTLSVDGTTVGVTPLDALELGAGDYALDGAAERYRSASTTVSVGGAGSMTEATLTLEPLWAPVTFDSTPPGARVSVDGEEVGRTPLTADVLEGGRGIEFRLDGYKPWRSTIRVVASQALTAPAPTLEPVDGWLTLTSEPAGARVSVDGNYRGVTPLELEMAPGSAHEISASLGGYRSAHRNVDIASGKTTEVHLDLEPELGEVEITVLPPDAELWVDGEARGTAGQTLELTSVPHEIEIRREGFETVTRQVTPRPGYPQALDVVLTSTEEAEEQAAAKLNPPSIGTSQGQELRLVQPGEFRMGASRREPGRRANETLRDVELTRAFYMATEEVSNEEFLEFRSSHRAGAAGSESLDLDDYPVVEVTWEDAARYCNWLSAKDGLDPYYVESGGTLTAANPSGTGYRLPTEAEWAWAARYAGGTTAIKYPWGDSLPVAPGSGNYADSSARAVLPATVSGYSDGHAATAPVDSFEPNALGLFNLGGNVAEWVHDVYSIYSSVSTDVDRDPRGPEEGDYHVIRGSSWMDSTVTELRLSYRDYGAGPRSDLGFRIARYAN